MIHSKYGVNVTTSDYDHYWSAASPYLTAEEVESHAS